MTTLTDVTDSIPVRAFDAVADDETLAPDADMTWGEFVEAAAAVRPETHQAALLAVVTLTGGGRGADVDIEQVSKVMGKRKGTVSGFLAKLADAGWLERQPRMAPGSNRSHVVLVTAKKIDG